MYSISMMDNIAQVSKISLHLFKYIKQLDSGLSAGAPTVDKTQEQAGTGANGVMKEATQKKERRSDDER